MVQALHLMNSAGVHKKLSADDGRVARLAKSDKPHAQSSRNSTFSPTAVCPTQEETECRRVALPRIPKATVVSAVEDLLWALLNSPEFVFKD